MEVNVIKKKGRPRKNPIVEVAVICDVEKKKRGRKKKEKVEEEVKIKKKRGRKAAVKFFSSSIRKKIPLTTVIQDNDKTILHLDIKECQLKEEKSIYNTVKEEYLDSEFKLVIDSSQISELKDEFNIHVEKNNEIDELEEFVDSDNNNNNINSIGDLYEKRLESRLNQDNLLIKHLENLHNDDDLIDKLINKSSDASPNINKKSKNVENRKQGFFTILESFYESKKWLHETNVCCWWCCHKFESIPIGLPLHYKNGKFLVKGIFCSFGCMIAYKNGNVKSDSDKSNMLIKFLFKKLTGVSSISSKESYKKFLESSLKLSMFGGDVSLKEEYIGALLKLCCEKLHPAPARETLNMFGGELTINEFRESMNSHKIFKLIEYPMFISRDYIEEVDIQNVKKINMNVFNNNGQSKANILDNKKVEDAKFRIQSKIENNVVTNNNIGKFLKF
jgi:hypothetical protein